MTRFRGRLLAVAGDRADRWSAEQLEHGYRWRTVPEGLKGQANRPTEVAVENRFLKSRNTGILTVVAFLFGG